MAINNKEKEKIFTLFKHHMGAPIRSIEMLDEMLDSALTMAIMDYGQYVQEWLIENQWQSLFGQNIDTTDMSFALSVRGFDFMTQATYAYSKQVGLQARGPWELKKDFIDVEAGRQVYQIPAGREVNEVLWITPTATDAALFANYGGFDTGFGGGFAQMGANAGSGGGTGMGGGGYYVAPAFDVLLTAQDFNLKNRLLRSELVYKITAGPDGTKLLHLMSTPGSKLSFAGTAGMSGSIGLSGCKVWYHYYETNAENLDDCLAANKDIIRYPNDVPLEEFEYSDFNAPTKSVVRQLFFAHAKMSLAHVRGKYGGIVGVQGAERTMNYEMIANDGKEERKEVLERLDERLLRLSSEKQTERAANESENLNRHLQYRPLGIYVK